MKADEKKLSRLRDGEIKKAQFVKRLRDKEFDRLWQAWNRLSEFKSQRRSLELFNRREKSKVVQRIVDRKLRDLAQGFRASSIFAKSELEKEISITKKLRGIVVRIMDSNYRLVSSGFNTLVAQHRHHRKLVSQKVKFIIKSLRDRGTSNLLLAYGGLKERCVLINGILENVAHSKRETFIKRLLDQSLRLLHQGYNTLRGFNSTHIHSQAKLAKRKEKVLRRLMDAQFQQKGIAYTAARKWLDYSIKSELQKIFRQKGVLRKLTDKTVKLMGEGYNRLVVEGRERMRKVGEKLRFVVRALIDRDAREMMMAYNGLRIGRVGGRVGAGKGRGEEVFEWVGKRLADRGFEVQCQAWERLKVWGVSAGRQEALARERREMVFKRIIKTSVGQMTTALRSVIAHSQKSVRHEQLITSRREKVFKLLASTTTG